MDGFHDSALPEEPDHIADVVRTHPEVGVSSPRPALDLGWRHRFYQGLEDRPAVPETDPAVERPVDLRNEMRRNRVVHFPARLSLAGGSQKRQVVHTAAPRRRVQATNQPVDRQLPDHLAASIQAHPQASRQLLACQRLVPVQQEPHSAFTLEKPRVRITYMHRVMVSAVWLTGARMRTATGLARFLDGHREPGAVQVL